MKNKSMPSSDSKPASLVGEVLTFDLHSLLVKSRGGNDTSIRIVDEFSGDLQVNGSDGKSSIAVFKSFMHIVHTRYNAHGHRVSRAMCDSEPTLKSLVAMFGMVGIELSFFPPGQHAQRIERYIGFSDDRKVAVLSGLSYILPQSLDLYADR
jgi:hypothetical protein